MENEQRNSNATTPAERARSLALILSLIAGCIIIFSFVGALVDSSSKGVNDPKFEKCVMETYGVDAGTPGGLHILITEIQNKSASVHDLEKCVKY